MPKETLTWVEIKGRYKRCEDMPAGLRIATDRGVILVTVKEDGDTFFNIVDPLALVIEKIQEEEDAKRNTNMGAVQE